MSENVENRAGEKQLTARKPIRNQDFGSCGSLALNSSSAASRPSESNKPDAGEISANEDRELIERARFGDHSAFEQLVKKYQDRTIWIARKFVSDMDSARDIAQEAFLRVYRSLHRYDPKHRFYTWYYRIVVHLAIDHMRKQRKVVQWKLKQAPLGQTELWEPAGRHVEHDETRENVQKVLDQVPTKYRMLIVLRDLEGFTSKEIADLAGWNHATVRWRLHRARKLFKEAWEAAGLPREVG